MCRRARCRTLRARRAAGAACAAVGLRHDSVAACASGCRRYRPQRNSRHHRGAADARPLDRASRCARCNGARCGADPGAERAPAGAGSERVRSVLPARNACRKRGSPPDRSPVRAACARALRRAGPGNSGHSHSRTEGRTGARSNPLRSRAALRSGHPSRRPAQLSHRPARVLAPRRHRHRSIPGIGAVSRHAGGGAARKPRRALVVRGEPEVFGLDRGRPRRLGRTRRGTGLCRTAAVPGGDRRRRAHGLHARGATGLRSFARHGPAPPADRRLAAGKAGERPVRLCQPRRRPRRARRRRRAGVRAGAGAAQRRRAHRLPAADPRQPHHPGLQVPRRTLRLGPLLRHPRLQRLRFRGVPQLRRGAAAQHPRPGREPRLRPHRLHRGRRPRRAHGGAAESGRGRPALHSRPRDDDDWARGRRSLVDSRHHRHALPRCFGEIVSVPLNQVSVTPLFALLGDSGTPYVDFIYSIQRIRRVSPR